MVMADKQSIVIRNGKRSRGPSPNSSEHSDSSDDQEKGIRIGEEYQAEIPPYNPDQKSEPLVQQQAMLVWAPASNMSGAKVDEYISVAKEKHGYNTEQALGMLFWHKHNVDRALSDLANFTPFPDEWSMEDKVLFEQAYNFHGKQFPRIRQMLPDKSIPSLVKYFYSWKKTRQRTSMMDRHAKKQGGEGEEGQGGDGSDAGSNDSDHDISTKEEEENLCVNCGLKTSQLHVSSAGSQCSSCYQYWRRTGVMRSAGPKRHESTQARHNPIKHKRRPPKGMHLDSSDIHTFVTSSTSHNEAILKGLDAEVVALKRQVQNRKQMLSLQKHKIATGVDNFRPGELPHKINSRWSNEDLLLAVQGVRKYGKDFKAIAEVIGNKLEVHVRSFYHNFRRRYNLDEVFAEFEAENGTQVIPDDEEMPTDSTTSTTTTPTSTTPGVLSSSGHGASKDTAQVENGDGKDVPALARAGPHINGTTGHNPHPLPPPLLPHPAPIPQANRPAAATTTTPTTTSMNSRLVAPQKTILQQPPPLIRPSPVPVHSGPKTTLPAVSMDLTQ